jgi:regulator of replication initiation timing
MADSIDHTDPDAQLREVLEGLRDDPDALIEIILRQARQIRELTSRVEQLEQKVRELSEENERLREEREEAEREGKRQAAPFRTDENERSGDPDPPGRKEGHEASYRREPEQIDRRVETPMKGCPECGDPVDEVRPIRQIVEELPPIEPETVEVVTYRGECEECGTVETTHRLKTTEATGAAQVHLGPRAQAITLLLRERHGLTMRRTCGVLEDGFGLDLSPGGLAQMIQRCASRLEAEEDRLLEAARSSEVQHVDETSWWVAQPEFGEPRRQPQGEKSLWWLWVFANEEQTVFRVDPRRDRDVVQRVLDSEYEGVLVSDCLQTYDDATPVQQKCYAHHLKAISTAQGDYKAKIGEPSSYLSSVKGLLIGAKALKKAKPDLSEARAKTCRRALEDEADRLLAPGRADSLTEIEDKIRRRLKKQRDHLFVFLDHESVPATNNRAERQLRPAVIRRKLSCGNRTPRGGRAFERMASVVETCVQQGRSVVDYLTATMSLGIEPLPLR